MTFKGRKHFCLRRCSRERNGLVHCVKKNPVGVCVTYGWAWTFVTQGAKAIDPLNASIWKNGASRLSFSHLSHLGGNVK